jgi:hypothetical protein
MSAAPLTEQQQADADRLAEALRPRLDQLITEVSSLLAANADNPFGATEFLLRDLLLRAGADVLQAALREKKTAMKARP